MKIQKLTIHNIASIEDAEVDFEQPPLSNSDVFLITGKTGSGKSTILDAICLALYANTPRLANTKMQGDVDEGNTVVKINDARQLMRNNTGEAYARLTFTGKNGVRYEAQWTARRANNKPTGKLQAKDWSLTNLDTGMIFSKDKDIIPEIQTAIGLDFQQFCRTTMLAQGDFTRFLNSGDNDKADILEKITGVDIYSKIGAKIYKITGDKKKEWELADCLKSETKTLSDDEIARKNQELQTLDAEFNKNKELSEKAKAKCQWLKKENEITAQVNNATSNLQKAKERIESEDFKRKDALVKSWNSTIEARGWLNDGLKAKRTQSDQEKILQDLSSIYIQLLGGQEFAKNAISKIENEIQNINSFFEKEKTRTSIFENAQTIAGQLKILAEGRENIRKQDAAIAQEKRTLNEQLQPVFQQAQKAENESKSSLELQMKAVSELEKSIADLKLLDLRNQYSIDIQLIGKIGEAKHCLNTLTDTQNRRADAGKNLEDSWKLLEEKKQHSADLDSPLHDAQIILDDRKKSVENQKDTINKFAQTLRAKLHIGDVCPVCRQKIEAELPHEAELTELVANLELKYKEAEQEYNDLYGRKVEIEAEIKSDTTTYAKAKKAYETDTSVLSATEKALVACQACGLNVIDDYTWQNLMDLESKTSEEKELLDKKIKAGEMKEQELAKMRQILENQRKASDILIQKTREAEQKVNDCKIRITNTETLVKAKKQEVQIAEEQVRKYIGTTVWQYDWNSTPTECADEILNAAKTYNSNVQKRQQLASEFQTAQTDISNVAEVLEDIRLLQPEWMSIQAVKETKVERLLTIANNLRTNVATALEKLNVAQKTREENRTLLNDFMQKNGDIAIDKLSELDQFSSDEIAMENNLLENARSAVVAATSLLASSKQSYETHQQNKPKFAENETLEYLENQIVELENTLCKVSENRGAINQELATDADNRHRLTELLQDAEAKRTEYLKWSRLNGLIGDATGSKFRRIAQSYVLENLIHSANHYMHTLTDRYTLNVEPGTFVIMIEDAYQGFTRRAASTISGGESFLVSLALALALSDIGQSLSVDTLFIDEGFGTLSGEPLQNAVNTLRTLQSHSGRHVGIISHVEELQERIPVQIQVLQDGNNSSSQIKIV